MGKLKPCCLGLIIICLFCLCGCGHSLQDMAPVPQDTLSAVSGGAAVGSIAESSDSASVSPTDAEAMIGVLIQIDGQELAAKLYDNETTRALIELFPLEIQMNDLNSNEKYFYLPESLPTHPESVGDINAGDIMLYGSDCLVLFYESFPTSYRYTRLGYIENASDLREWVGDADVQMMFRMANTPYQ